MEIGLVLSSLGMFFMEAQLLFELSGPWDVENPSEVTDKGDFISQREETQGKWG
jgi:hypothetical protein